MDKEKLIDKVIDQILEDVIREDYTAIQELLCSVPEAVLKNYVGEDK